MPLISAFRIWMSIKIPIFLFLFGYKQLAVLRTTHRNPLLFVSIYMVRFQPRPRDNRCTCFSLRVGNNHRPFVILGATRLPFWIGTSDPRLQSVIFVNKAAPKGSLIRLVLIISTSWALRTLIPVIIQYVRALMSPSARHSIAMKAILLGS